MFRTLSVSWLLVMLVAQGHGGRADAFASQQFGVAPDHPLVGMWMTRHAPAIAGEPWALAPAEFRADGSMVLMIPVTHDHNGELMFTTMAIGTWRPTGPQEARFTVIQAVFDANGHYHGTETTEGFPVVSASGQTFVDSGAGPAIVSHDASGMTVPDIGRAEPDSPMMATRILPGAGGGKTPCGPLVPFCE